MLQFQRNVVITTAILISSSAGTKCTNALPSSRHKISLKDELIVVHSCKYHDFPPPPPPQKKNVTPVTTHIFTHHTALTATDDTTVQQHYTVSLTAHPVKIELRMVRRRAEKKTQSINMPLTSKVRSPFVGPNGSLIGTI
jgi:hypothetical protein